ncbi:hypothetical protein NKG05_28430 [Oerskovia sp. M15]
MPTTSPPSSTIASPASLPIMARAASATVAVCSTVQNVVDMSWAMVVGIVASGSPASGVGPILDPTTA